jgi:hypothetical protein
MMKIMLFLAVMTAAWLMAPVPVLAGGDGFGPDDHAPDEGAAYFGFVKDERGAPVRDAKVSASYKTSLTLLTRTDATGAYKVRGFKNTVNPNDVIITCAKEGYKQIRVSRRPLPKVKDIKDIKSVETECRLQRQ